MASHVEAEKPVFHSFDQVHELAAKTAQRILEVSGVRESLRRPLVDKKAIAARREQFMQAGFTPNVAMTRVTSRTGTELAQPQSLISGRVVQEQLLSFGWSFSRRTVERLNVLHDAIDEGEIANFTDHYEAIGLTEDGKLYRIESEPMSAESGSPFTPFRDIAVKIPELVPYTAFDEAMVEKYPTPGRGFLVGTERRVDGNDPYKPILQNVGDGLLDFIDAHNLNVRVPGINLGSRELPAQR